MKITAQILSTVTALADSLREGECVHVHADGTCTTGTDGASTTPGGGWEDITHCWHPSWAADPWDAFRPVRPVGRPPVAEEGVRVTGTVERGVLARAVEIAGSQSAAVRAGLELLVSHGRREVLSGEVIVPQRVTRVALPRDNWYTHEDLDSHPAVGTAQPSYFGLHDDGAGPRWFPIE